MSRQFWKSSLTFIRLNPLVKYTSHEEHLATDTVLDIFDHYDIILDCTDNPASRYLISDACVLLQKPLVSASALRTEGQLMVLNWPPRQQGDDSGGPCYRCVFPRPPPAETVVSCGDGGILGPVVGVMGVMQALEAIKMISSGAMEKNCSIMQKATNGAPEAGFPNPTLLMFSAYSNPQFRAIRLRGRKLNCAACSGQASITPVALKSGSMDYVQFCGAVGASNLLSPQERVSATAFAQSVNSDLNVASDAPILIDVRPEVQFQLCHLEGSHNIPFSTLSSLPQDTNSNAQSAFDKATKSILQASPPQPIYVVCRLGNDSQTVVRQFKKMGLSEGGKRWIGDIEGGLTAWRRQVDPEFPDY